MELPLARDVKVFVPTKDFDLSLRFYESIGWRRNWREDGLAEIELASIRLYLQDFYVKEWAENFMIHVVVEDTKGWYDHISFVIQNHDFLDARVEPPKQESYGALVTYVWDPCGVLLHFAQLV
ncbi:MAG: hypothetical protein ACFCD0_14090 [Gemmataceae bacterium]